MLLLFYGGGNYCRKLIENWLPDCLLPVAIFDTSKTERFSIGPIQICNLNEIAQWKHSVSKIVITSPAHHEEISSMLETKFSREKIRVEILTRLSHPRDSYFQKLDNKSILSFFVFHFFDRLDFDGSTPQSRWIFQR